MSMFYDYNFTQPHFTAKGTSYFKKPGVTLIAQPAFERARLRPFLQGFNESLEFMSWMDDPTDIEFSDELVKFAGQLCYLSFGPKRTTNADAPKYMDNIKEQRHGSVFEHANFTFLFWGVSRSFTHELVRHRAGFGFSQVSQRYVDGKALRFVERPEFQGDERLHAAFEAQIDDAAENYEARAALLLEALAPSLEAMAPTERRKAVNQAARSVLPNETEAPIVVTANARAWRHFIEMRCSKAAEPEARVVAFAVLSDLCNASDHLFSDYTSAIDDRGFPYVTTKTNKV